MIYIYIYNQNNNEDPNKNCIIYKMTKNTTITTDGPVRNTTVLIPCNVYIDIPNINCFNEFRIVSKDLKVFNTQYILNTGKLTYGTIPIGEWLNAMEENYIVSIEIEAI